MILEQTGGIVIGEDMFEGLRCHCGVIVSIPDRKW